MHKPVSLSPSSMGRNWTLAYCAECGDGVNAPKVTAEQWAANHLRKVHGVSE